jgi:solute carrier family 12 sodium/potassium/chloride transporter 2
MARKKGFGTLEVFVTSISTILGAVLFLRFGWAVGNLGLIQTLGIILLGHLVTFPTAMAVAEISTNQKVLGGGAYFIISRSFGLNIGAAVGISLYFSQAISIAFYVIAFSEAFSPVFDYFFQHYGWYISDIWRVRIVSLPTMVLLAVVVLRRGANVGMKALYFVAILIGVAIVMFLMGKPIEEPLSNAVYKGVENPVPFFFVLAIVFPAFTGLAAGLGLSGELRNPQVSIPRGTLLATIVGGLVYIAVAYKLSISATPEDLSRDYLIMQKIAIWGPIIPIGLGAAALSSAIGSILVAPRTLQAIGADDIFRSKRLNRFFSKGKGRTGEPQNANILTIIIASFVVSLGSIDSVAEIISMFFMVTYGAICLVSLLENFAADPSYRPTFRTRWHFSLIGAVASFWFMFQMNAQYASFAMLAMAFIYILVSRGSQEGGGFVKLFRGVIFQLSRQLQILAQRVTRDESDDEWRPFAICISKDTFGSRSAFNLLSWLSYKYGFGTYIHFIEGFLSKETTDESKMVLKELINLASKEKNRMYLDTMISPSYTTAVAQTIQLTGISGQGNNLILFDFDSHNRGSFQTTLDNYPLIHEAGFDICVLNHSIKGFGKKKELHVWITADDLINANLMILLAYIIIGHPDWKRGQIKIFALYWEEELEEKHNQLLELIKSGRLPISKKNINLIPLKEQSDLKKLITKKSACADLAIVGFQHDMVQENGVDAFCGYEDICNVLFVNSQKDKVIK